MTTDCTPYTYARVFRVQELKRLKTLDAGVIAAARAGQAWLRGPDSPLPKDQGELRQSATVTIGERRPGTVSVLAEVVLDAPYAMCVEAGTRPHYPPIAPLLAWCARHGLDNGVAYAIQKTIGKFGTKPTWAMRNSLPKLRAILAEKLGVAAAAR